MTSADRHLTGTTGAADHGAATTAYQLVRSRILGMHLTESAFLTETSVAKELGISRTPVRQAFQRLAAENLLELLPQKGAFIPPIRHREAADVLQLRELIETFSVRTLLTCGEHVAGALADLLEQQRLCLQAGDDNGFIAADRSFHLAVVYASGNSVMTGVYERLRDRQLRMGVRAVASSPRRQEEVLTEHQNIVQAISDSDVDMAEAAIRDHLHNTLVALRTQW